MGAHDISVPWRRFLAADRVGDHQLALEELRNFIRCWDDAFWADDFDSFGAVYTEDVVITNKTRLPSVIGPAPQTGIDGFLKLRGELMEAAKFFRFDIEELRHGEGGKIVALGRMRVRSRYAGVVLRAGFATIWTIRGDKICRAEGFTNRRHALRDAGISGRPEGEEPDWEEGGSAVDPEDHEDLGD